MYEVNPPIAINRRLDHSPYRISYPSGLYLTKQQDLRSRLGNELIGTLKMLYEPLHSVATGWPELYHSAMMAGDPDYALVCHWNSCSCKIFMGENLSSLSIQIEILMKEAVGVMLCIMFNFNF